MQFSIKYRPRTFKEVFGQDHIKRALQNRAKTRDFPKAMLLKGKFGTGKTTIAQIIAMTIQCPHLDAEGNPCGVCPSCRSIIEERFDRDTMMLDGSQIGQKDNVIEFTSIIGVTPLYDANRVFIIEEADQLSTAASNALLKVLEDPHEKTYFILLSMEAKGLSSAIQSRCQFYYFKPLSIKDTMFALKSILEKEGLWNNPDIPQQFKLEGLSLIATASNGSLRVAVQMLEQAISMQAWNLSELEGSLGIPEQFLSYKILHMLAEGNNNPDMWASIYDADAHTLYNYITLILADVALYKATGYIKDPGFASNIHTLAGYPHIQDLIDAFTLNAHLDKAYIRKADLLLALADYYKKYIRGAPSTESAPPVRRIPVR